jgi:hypothetical protein
MRDKTFKAAILIIENAIKDLPRSFQHTVTHTIEPLPTEKKIDGIVITVINSVGERWVMPGIIIDPNQTRAMINGFPYQFISGDTADAAKQCSMEMEIHYKDVPIRNW